MAEVDYFAPPDDGSWRWDAAGDFIESADGGTIAHRLLVHKCLHALRLDLGLPAFHSLVTCLRQGVTEPEAIVRVLSRSPMLFHGDAAERIVDTLLVPVRSASRPVRTELAGLSTLIDQLEDWKVRSSSDKKNILETGLDAPPEAMTEELSLAEQVTGLLTDLDRDPELVGIAVLARHLLGLVHLPRTVNDPQDLPLGGYSDISNKGQLDRLLLSELAHDDDVLMSRVAMREALYLRRESPPLPRPESCQILIDSTVRMWGVRRVFAASVALALAIRSGGRGGRSERALHVYHTHADGPRSVTLGTKDGLCEHLAHLDPSHLSLPNLAELIQDHPDAGETVLITSEELFEDEEFTHSLDVPPGHLLYVATVQPAGRFQLWLVQAKSRRRLQQGTVDLQMILPQEAPRIRREELADNAFPGFFRLRPCPIRVPNFPFSLMSSFHAYCPKRGLLRITSNSEFLHRRCLEDGVPDMLPQHLGFLPPGKFLGPFWYGDGSPQAACLVHDGSAIQFVHMDRDSKLHVVQNEHPLIVSHAWVRDHWIIAGGRGATVFHPESGEVVASGPNPAAKLRADGLVQQNNPKGTFVPRISFSGKTLRWERLSIRNDVLQVCRLPNQSEWFQLCDNGDFRSVSDVDHVNELLNFHQSTSGWLGTRYIPPPNSFHFRKLSTCGRFLQSVNAARINLENFEVEDPGIDHEVRQVAEHDVNMGQIIKRITMVGTHGNRLVLIDKDRCYSPDRKLNGQWIWAQRRIDDSFRPENMKAFKPVKGPDPWGTELRCAEFPDGSRAWHDLRGFLHLRSSSVALPEITISLQDPDRPFAAWTSNQLLFGPDDSVEKPDGDQSDLWLALLGFVRGVSKG